MSFKKCPHCGSEEFIEFAKCDTLQKGVRIGEKNGAIKSRYDDAGTVDMLDDFEVTGYMCGACSAELPPEFGGHKPSPTRIAIGVEGGLVTGVSSDRPVEVLVLDYDTEGVEDDHISVINGNECCAGQYPADLLPDVVAKCYGDSAAEEEVPHAG